MTVIGARLTKNPRRARRCGGCCRMIHGPQVRLFGAGFSTDPPTNLYLHPECASDETKVKLGIEVDS